MVRNEELEELEEIIAQWEEEGVYSGDATYQRMLMRRNDLLNEEDDY